MVLKDREEYASAAQRSQIVAQDLALPARIGEVEPALGFIRRLYQCRVRQDAVDDGKHRKPYAITGKFGLQMTKAGERAVGLENVVFLDLQRGRRSPVLRHIRR